MVLAGPLNVPDTGNWNYEILVTQDIFIPVFAIGRWAKKKHWNDTTIFFLGRKNYNFEIGTTPQLIFTNIAPKFHWTPVHHHNRRATTMQRRVLFGKKLKFFFALLFLHGSSLGRWSKFSTYITEEKFLKNSSIIYIAPKSIELIVHLQPRSSVSASGSPLSFRSVRRVFSIDHTKALYTINLYMLSFTMAGAGV